HLREENDCHPFRGGAEARAAHEAKVDRARHHHQRDEERPDEGTEGEALFVYRVSGIRAARRLRLLADGLSVADRVSSCSRFGHALETAAVASSPTTRYRSRSSVPSVRQMRNCLRRVFKKRRLTRFQLLISPLWRWMLRI